MAKIKYDVVIKVIGGKRPCKRGHKPGDEWLMTDHTPGGLCTLAFNAMYPLASALQFGATFPWQKDNPDVTPVSCPDPEVNTIFELKRIPRE